MFRIKIGLNFSLLLSFVSRQKKVRGTLPK